MYAIICSHLHSTNITSQRHLNGISTASQRHLNDKSCMSSTSQHKSKQSKQGDAPHVTVTTMAEPTPEESTLNITLDPISLVQTDIKLLDNKLSEHILSSLSCQTSVSSLSNKETIDALTKECDSSRSAIDMLMTLPSREIEVCSKRMCVESERPQS